MRINHDGESVLLWLSASDTSNWASRWPCSCLRGKRLFAAFDENGLYDVAVNGGRGEQDCPGDEFNAITADFIKTRLPKEHPCYFVTVGQFKQP